jgi:hypothetical protein
MGSSCRWRDKRAPRKPLEVTRTSRPSICTGSRGLRVANPRADARRGTAHRDLRRDPERARGPPAARNPHTVSCLPVMNATDGNTKGPTDINGAEVDPLIGWCLTYPINPPGTPPPRSQPAWPRATCRSACKSSGAATPTPTCSRQARRSNACAHDATATTWPPRANLERIGLARLRRRALPGPPRPGSASCIRYGSRPAFRRGVE